MTEPDTTLCFPDLGELLNKLKFEPVDGKVWVNERRAVLLDLFSLASFRHEIVMSLGVERAKGFFMRLGYYSGLRDAELARQLHPDMPPEKAFLTGPQMHALRGMVKVVPLYVEFRPEEPHFHASFEWIDSFEVEIARTHLGPMGEPVCWSLIGYACAYSSHFTGLEIQYREVECQGHDDERCIIVGKLAHEWDDAENFRQLFKISPLIDEFYELQSRIVALEKQRLDASDIPPALGEAPPFTSALKVIDQGAPSDVTMLLIGETGTGKEILARRVHSMSRRKEGPFVAVNCAAIPPELIEAELFGVEKGAYTGATQSRSGRFERAHGGTLFLDEVIELSPRAQAALLRALQEGEIERVGGTRSQRVDVRIVAATNEDLAMAVQQGKFRADLFYRINAYTVVVPPLRQRRNDIGLLAEHFRKRYEHKYQRNTQGLTDRAMQALNQHHWPGNIRELENIIERAVILTPENQSISEELVHSSVRVSTPLAPEHRVDAASGTLKAVCSEAATLERIAEQVLDQRIELAKLEDHLLRSALRRADDNYTEAASLLGMTRAAFAYRVKKSGKEA